MGRLLIEPDRKYFSDLLNVGGTDGGQETIPNRDDLHNEGQDSQMTLEEMKASISQMKRVKAVGDDRSQ